MDLPFEKQFYGGRCGREERVVNLNDRVVIRPIGGTLRQFCLSLSASRRHGPPFEKLNFVFVLDWLNLVFKFEMIRLYLCPLLFF